jgi:hypothetical protein
MFHGFPYDFSSNRIEKACILLIKCTSMETTKGKDTHGVNDISDDL